MNEQDKRKAQIAALRVIALHLVIKIGIAVAVKIVLRKMTKDVPDLEEHDSEEFIEYVTPFIYSVKDGRIGGLVKVDF